MRKIASAIGTVAGFAVLLFRYANRIANTLQFLDLPDDVKTALVAMSQIPTLLAWGAFVIGLLCLGYLIHGSHGTKIKAIATKRVKLLFLAAIFFVASLAGATASAIWIYKILNMPTTTQVASNDSNDIKPHAPITYEPPVGDLFWVYTKTTALDDAAKKIYADTRTTFAASLAEANAAPASYILLWYGYAIINMADEVWGVRPPSDKHEPLNLKGFKLTSDPKSGFISAPIPGNSASYINLRLPQSSMDIVTEKIRALNSKPDWAPEPFRAAEAATPTKPAESKPAEMKPAVNEKNLIGSATLLFNADDDTLTVLKYEGIKSVAVEPVSTLTATATSYVVTFVFYPHQGPFDIRVDGDVGTLGQSPGLNYNVNQNEDRFVSVIVTKSYMIPRTHQTWFRFYRKSQ